MDILEALLDLNKVLMLEGYKSDFEIEMRDEDFEKFVFYFESKHQGLVNYPQLNPFLTAAGMQNKTLKDISLIRIAGPGSYFLVRRKQS